MTTRFDFGRDDMAYHALPINTTVQTDRSHLHAPYRYAKVFWEKIILWIEKNRSYYFKSNLNIIILRWSLSLWYLSVLLLLIYLKPETPLDKENITK